MSFDIFPIKMELEILASFLEEVIRIKTFKKMD